MKTLLLKLKNDEAGFIVSAELVLIGSIAVLALIVGLAEVSLGINHELEDVGAAFGSANQSYYAYGTKGHGAVVGGSRFSDRHDFCDSEFDLVRTNPGRELKHPRHDR